MSVSSTIFNWIAEWRDVDIENLKGQSRLPKHCHARHEAWYLIRETDPKRFSYPMIARLCNRTDHGTIIRGIRSHKRRLEQGVQWSEPAREAA